MQLSKSMRPLLRLRRSFSNKALSLSPLLKAQSRLNNMYFGSSNPSMEQKEALFQSIDKIRSDVELLSLYYLHLSKSSEFESEAGFLIHVLENSKDSELLRAFESLLQHYFYSSLRHKESSNALQGLWKSPAFKNSGFRSKMSSLYSESTLTHDLDPQSLVDHYKSLPLTSLNLIDSCYYQISLYKTKSPFQLSRDLYLTHHRTQRGSWSTWIPLYVLHALEKDEFIDATSVPLKNDDWGSVNVKLRILSSGGRFDEGSLLLRSSSGLELCSEVFDEWKKGMLSGGSQGWRQEFDEIHQNICLAGNILILPELSLSQFLIKQIYNYFNR